MAWTLLSQPVAMEIDLRNVPFSEELLFFIRRCAGDSGAEPTRARPARGIEIRLRRIEVPRRTYEACLVRRDDGAIVLETDPDVYLAVRNAFEILRARDRRGGSPTLPVAFDAAADAKP